MNPYWTRVLTLLEQIQIIPDVSYQPKSEGPETGMTRIVLYMLRSRSSHRLEAVQDISVEADGIRTPYRAGHVTPVPACGRLQGTAQHRAEGAWRRPLQPCASR